MKLNCKTACILVDENDLKDFKDSYRDAVSQESLLVPFDSISGMQAMFYESDESYYIPKMFEGGEFSAAKSVYLESQRFLKQLLLSNKIVDEIEDFFPLELPWFCVWVAINRTVAFCSDFINKYSVREVILIRRNKFFNHGGLLISTASFTDLIEAFFKSKSIKVRVFKHKDSYQEPKTIFYSQKCGVKSSLKHLVKLIYWKILSFNKKNYSHILIKPGYDNKVFSSSNKMFPQVFHGVKLPFLHSWVKSLRFLIKKGNFKYRYSDNNCNVVSPYKSNLCNFEFDFAKTFQSTIVRYLKDLRWMKSYINMFWDSCLERRRRYLTIFSSSPAHLDSYFLIKKAKENLGKSAVWQHGGVFSYTDYFPHYITDYKSADYFLSFGKCNIKEVAKSMGSAYPVGIEVGSNVIYGKPVPNNLRGEKTKDSQGLFIPSVIGRFCGQKNVNWRGDLQFAVNKQIVDFFGLGKGGNIVFKGLKKHLPHQEIQRYIEMKRYEYVSYSDISIDRALSNNPEFVILDVASTMLLQALAQYSGPIFLIISQKTFSIRGDALTLLKRRVVYSESVDELSAQLTEFFKKGTLNGVNTEDTSFRDVYLKKFDHAVYERFLQEATSTLQ